MIHIESTPYMIIHYHRHGRDYFLVNNKPTEEQVLWVINNLGGMFEGDMNESWETFPIDVIDLARYKWDGNLQLLQEEG